MYFNTLSEVKFFTCIYMFFTCIYMYFTSIYEYFTCIYEYFTSIFRNLILTTTTLENSKYRFGRFLHRKCIHLIWDSFIYGRGRPISSRQRRILGGMGWINCRTEDSPARSGANPKPSPNRNMNPNTNPNPSPNPIPPQMVISSAIPSHQTR